MSFDAACFLRADRDTRKSPFLLIYEIGRNIGSDQSECTGARIHFLVVFLDPILVTGLNETNRVN